MTRVCFMGWVLAGCVGGYAEPAQVADSDAPVVEASLVEQARFAYDIVRADLEAERQRLAERLDEDREAVLMEARSLVLQRLTQDLIPAWHDTPWAFYGTSTTPGEGTIACGYYVSTLLEHAGFRVERVKLAQQASENIIRSFTPAKRIRRFRNRPASEVIAEVERQGEGLYVLGLDYHAALLWNDGERVRMCHSSVTGPGTALCEDALTSPAMVSRYRVVGKLLDDAMVEGWLRGRAFPTRVR